MKWVKARLGERQSLIERNRKIASGIDPIWMSLCEALQDSIRAFTDGTPQQRFDENLQNHHAYWVEHVVDGQDGKFWKEKVTVILDQRLGGIRAVYSEDCAEIPERMVKFDLDHNGKACLWLDGSAVGTAAVAGYFLDPFLFPELT